MVAGGRDFLCGGLAHQRRWGRHVREPRPALRDSAAEWLLTGEAQPQPSRLERWVLLGRVTCSRSSCISCLLQGSVACSESTCQVAGWLGEWVGGRTDGWMLRGGRMCGRVIQLMDGWRMDG